MTTVLFAFLAGTLTILSPCVLPVIPILLGAGGSGRRRRLLAVIAGFGGTFVLTTVVLASALAAAGLSTDRLRLLSAILIAAFGLTIAVPALGRIVERLSTSSRSVGPWMAGSPDTGGFGSSLVLGSVIGFVWAPCVGPIMAATIAAAITSGPTTQATLVAVAYVAGASIPMAGVAVAGRRAVGIIGSARRRDAVLRVFGAVTFAAGVAIATGLDVPLQASASGLLPAGWAAGLTAVEQPPSTLEEPDSARRQARTPTAATSDVEHPLPAPVSRSLPAAVPLDDLGPAPELTGISDWINSDPLTLASLRGKVVLVHFWTFACINCIHVQPFVKAWSERYADSGFVVVGVHTPELSFEREIGNVRDAVAKAGVRFPVAFDPSFATWNAYRNNYWPAFYFVDRAGNIRHVHFGEGDYDASEEVIRQLIAEQG